MQLLPNSLTGYWNCRYTFYIFQRHFLCICTNNFLFIFQKCCFGVETTNMPIANPIYLRLECSSVSAFEWPHSRVTLCVDIYIIYMYILMLCFKIGISLLYSSVIFLSFSPSFSLLWDCVDFLEKLSLKSRKMRALMMIDEFGFFLL